MKKIISACIVSVFLLSLCGFAYADTDFSQEASNSWAISDHVQPRSVLTQGIYQFQLGIYNLFINVNNNNGISASSGDRVILYSNVPTNDQKWRVDVVPGGYYVRTMLNPSLAMNYYHSSDNKCTLNPPENNYTNGKSDSLINFNFDAITLVDWSRNLNFTEYKINQGGVWDYMGNIWEIKRLA